MRAVKGHGTENDFVLLPDLDGAITLSPAAVRALCDRRAGIGADGVLRVVCCENDAEGKRLNSEDDGLADYFMDYRNADGSLAEMCGNGIRVVARYLNRAGLVEEDAAVATRGGIVRVRLDAGGDVSVQMGSPRVLADRPVVTVAHVPGRPALAALTLPNPHVVVELDDPATLEALDLSVRPAVAPGRPDGQNVEFVVRRGPRHLAMRVHERGSGETRSCGTGICAAVAAVATADGSAADGATWRVDVPGGSCRVVWHQDGGIELIGPAVLVAELDIDDKWLAAAAARDSG